MPHLTALYESGEGHRRSPGRPGHRVLRARARGDDVLPVRRRAPVLAEPRDGRHGVLQGHLRAAGHRGVHARSDRRIRLPVRQQGLRVGQGRRVQADQAVLQLLHREPVLHVAAGDRRVVRREPGRAGRSGGAAATAAQGDPARLGRATRRDRASSSSATPATGRSRSTTTTAADTPTRLASWGRRRSTPSR